MTTAMVHTLLEKLARDHAACGVIVRTQTALVRALANEVERPNRQGANMTALLEQLDEEIERLARMLGNEAPCSSAVARSTERAAT
jgi:hypothetical protein